jgi:hypothetical protein
MRQRFATLRSFHCVAFLFYRSEGVGVGVGVSVIGEVMGTIRRG